MSKAAMFSTPNEMQAQRQTPNRSPRTDVAIAAVLVGVMFFAGNDPTLVNVLLRIGCWVVFVLFVVRTQFLWQPGPSSWFVIAHAINYGSWPAFYLIGLCCFAHTSSFVTVAGRAPEVGFAVDTGSFILMVTAWAVVRLTGPAALFNERKKLLVPFSGTLPEQKAQMLIVIAAGIFGAIMILAAPHAPSVLIQPLLLFGYFLPSSLAILVLTSDRAEHWLTRFRWPLIIAIGFGIVAFASSGLKSYLFLTLFFLAWFAGSCYKKLRLKILIAAVGLFAAFILLLPAFQVAKERFGETRSRAATLEALKAGLSEGVSDRSSYLNFRGKGFAEAIWEYLGGRLCMAGMTRQYYERYSEYQLGYESMQIAIRTAIPRIIDPNKISTDAYYNQLAILSGIGNRYDFTTSRKPTFQDECIVVWGAKGFLLGGIAFGIYLTILEHLASLATRNAASLAVLRFTWVPFGQHPYVAAIVGGNTYAAIFCLLAIVHYCHLLWPHREKKASLRQTDRREADQGENQWRSRSKFST
jgi:hypothetical protein